MLGWLPRLIGSAAVLDGERSVWELFKKGVFCFLCSSEATVQASVGIVKIIEADDAVVAGHGFCVNCRNHTMTTSDQTISRVS